MTRQTDKTARHTGEMPQPMIFSASSFLFREWLEAEVQKRKRQAADTERGSKGSAAPDRDRDNPSHLDKK